jgi:phage baseplate assembly protein W
MAQKLSFKDVGIEYEDPRSIDVGQSVIPFGFKTPLELDYTGESIFKMHYNLADQISDNLRNLILTNNGERLAFYSFGANLRPLLTEFANKQAFDSEVMKRIKKTVSIYMPYVELLGYESKADRTENQSTAIIKFLIAYAAPDAGLKETILEVGLFVT